MSRESKVVPFSLKDAPALIERHWPAQKLSAEAQKERNAGAGQRLTALGSYWKGRKPLVLVRACILGALLPATDDAEADLALFEKLMAIDDAAFRRRVRKPAMWPRILDMAYVDRLDFVVRPEELAEDADPDLWLTVNKHLNTCATNIHELVDQLGVMRYGRRPRVGDTFAGGGSIPFEAARMGCDAFATDLNPIACMLTWGALNVVGASAEQQRSLRAAQQRVAAEVDSRIRALGFDLNEAGDRGKAYIYCLETKCPQTGWLVPMSPSWIVSKVRRVVAVLTPDRDNKRFGISIVSGASDSQMQAATLGTVRDGNLVYAVDDETFVTPIKTLRGDCRDANGQPSNALRAWRVGDIVPQEGDIFRERLYCIQWMTSATLNRARPEVYFATPTTVDHSKELQVAKFVGARLGEWQEKGFVPEMRIEPGIKTDELIRTRGWTHWHHLFAPRQLVVGALVAEAIAKEDDELRAMLSYERTFIADKSARLSRWEPGFVGRPGVATSAEAVKPVFYNQALNTLYNFGVRGYRTLMPGSNMAFAHVALAGTGTLVTSPASAAPYPCDLFVTDPPYADAVVYDEITEFFIAWLRKNPPAPFADWTWDSRRALAIRGEGESFRHRMVEAYKAMTDHMPDNGMQIVMFTHQSGEVWADMAQIFWGAGLQVMAAWYIATETTSELKKGGYVQGTVILVLRKRKADEAGYRDEIVQEIKAEVAKQIDTMVGLNQTLKGHGRIENLFEDADLQMAGYAAALRVLTAYARIDGTDMTREALRPRVKGEKNLVTDIIEFAVQVANEHLVPEGMDARVWERLTGSERFYCKMLDIETTGAKKLDNYQNFAKAFRVPDYAELMQSTKPNDATLKTGAQFKKAGFGDSEFGRSGTRAVLYALYELQAEVEGDLVLAHLRDLVDGYGGRRDDLAAVAAYIANKRQEVDAAEAQAARILHGLIRNERLGA